MSDMELFDALSKELRDRLNYGIKTVPTPLLHRLKLLVERYGEEAVIHNIDLIAEHDSGL